MVQKDEFLKVGLAVGGLALVGGAVAINLVGVGEALAAIPGSYAPLEHLALGTSLAGVGLAMVHPEGTKELIQGTQESLANGFKKLKQHISHSKSKESKDEYMKMYDEKEMAPRAAPSLSSKIHAMRKNLGWEEEKINNNKLSM